MSTIYPFTSKRFSILNYCSRSSSYSCFTITQSSYKSSIKTFIVTAIAKHWFPVSEAIRLGAEISWDSIKFMMPSVFSSATEHQRQNSPKAAMSHLHILYLVGRLFLQYTHPKTHDVFWFWFPGFDTILRLFNIGVKQNTLKVRNVCIMHSTHNLFGKKKLMTRPHLG